MTVRFAILRERGVLALGGEEARAWLQGLITNDVRKIVPDRCIYAALLTPQGKYLHDFIVAEMGQRLFVETEAARLADLKKRLTFYRLRSKVTIDDVTPDYEVTAIVGDGVAAKLGFDAIVPGRAKAFAEGVVYVDPRLPALGCRVLAPRGRAAPALAALGFEPALNYEEHRLSLGIPDGSRDMPPDGTFLLENNFEEMNGVDFDKGCYVGQETTTRTKRRGTVRRRLMSVRSDAALPPPGTPVMFGDREAGEMRSSSGTLGLASMRLDVVAEARSSGRVLTSLDETIRFEVPSWIERLTTD